LGNGKGGRNKRQPQFGKSAIIITNSREGDKCGLCEICWFYGGFNAIWTLRERLAASHKSGKIIDGIVAKTVAGAHRLGIFGKPCGWEAGIGYPVTNLG
jgi:hypothetical protein